MCELDSSQIVSWYSEFVSAVHNGCPFHLRVVNSAAPSSSTTDDDVSGSSEHDGNSGTAAAAALAASSTSWDADVRFWLQSNGLLKHESCFAGVAWTALPLLTAEDLRSRGVGSNDAARARIVQMFLKIDSSDWFNGKRERKKTLEFFNFLFQFCFRDF
jgi:hypothetical protein